MSEVADAEAPGLIFEIQRFSIHDGPGIRTTVFMKGCPLRCVWCHNPESIDSTTLVSFQLEKCIGCGYCFRVCPNRARRMVDGRHELARDLCEACGACASECWAGATELVGRTVNVEEVMAQVMRDKPFYDVSNGGLTLSGGEPLAQLEFTAALLRAAKADGLHCCVDTCGLAPFEAFERVIPDVDLFLFDIKEMDNDRHLEFTGAFNAAILTNLKRLHDNGAQVHLRLPIVPGLNDRPDHFEAVASLIRSLPGLLGVEIMPYHKLAMDKRRRLGLGPAAELPDASVDDSMLHRWIDSFDALGVAVVNRIAVAPNGQVG